ncbi:hypothetical protein Tco_0822400 [Tanacetum coccineum]|uniref:Uncharacterized protein n=1 Tax=Tanacetum coccineum TaxID=301880 RepID=A0ABQ5AJ59_9ASTR
MPSTPGGIESSCSRNSSISSIRKSLPPKGVNVGESESRYYGRSSRRIATFRESLSITKFEGHGLVIMSKGHLFTVKIY